MLGWDKNTLIFSPIITPFSKDINTILVIAFRVTRREIRGVGYSISKVSLFRFIFLGFLDLLDF